MTRIEPGAFKQMHTESLHDAEVVTELLSLPNLSLSGIACGIDLRGNTLGADPLFNIERAIGERFNCDVDEEGFPLTSFGLRATYNGLRKFYDKQTPTDPGVVIAVIDAEPLREDVEPHVHMQVFIPLLRPGSTDAVTQVNTYHTKGSNRRAYAGFRLLGVERKTAKSVDNPFAVEIETESVVNSTKDWRAFNQGVRNGKLSTH